MNDNELYLDNYEFYHSEPREKNHVSAQVFVLVGIKKDFLTQEIAFQTNVFQTSAISGCSLQIPEKNLLICSFYNPPVESDYHFNQDTVTSLFDEVFNSEKLDSFIVCGVFKIGEKDCDWGDYSSDYISFQSLLDLNIENDIVQIVAASGNLDIVLFSKSLDNCYCEKANDQISNLSNQFGVVSCVQLESNLTCLRENRFETKLSYCKADYDSLTQKVRIKKFSCFC